MKRCPKCRVLKHSIAFYTEWRGWVRKPSSYCKQCYKDMYIQRRDKQNGKESTGIRQASSNPKDQRI